MTLPLQSARPGSERHLSPLKRFKLNAHNGNGNNPVFLYVAYCKSFAKIGISENPKKRMQSMQSGCPFPIELLCAFPMEKSEAVLAETAVMEMLDASHWLDDWFKCTRNHARYAAETTAKKKSTDQPNVIETHSTARYPTKCRPIRGPDGTEYASIADAAKKHGVSRQAMRQRAHSRRSGWAFSDALDYIYGSNADLTDARAAFQ